MLSTIKNKPLYYQLLVPIVIVGLLSVFAIVFSAYRLGDSVSQLEQVYNSSDKKLRTIGELETSVIHLRALSLRHLASESYRSMSRIGDELELARLNVAEKLLIYAGYDQTIDEEESTDKLLSQTLQAYLLQLEEVIQLSADFEKEAAFISLTSAEQNHLSIINATLQELKLRTFEDISLLRRGVASNADDNVSATISIGIAGLILMTLIAFVVIRRTTLRLATILDWSRAIASGNLSAPLKVDSDDEVGRLTGSMKTMAQSIKQAHDELDGARRQAEGVAEELQLYAKAFDNSGEAMLITDEHNHIVNVNSTFTTQTGYTLDDVLGKDPKTFASGETPPAVYRELWQAVENDGFWQGELWDCKKNGEVFPKWISISAIRDSNGKAQFYIASFSDISERKESEARIEHLAHHDILTGLLNRFSMEERLEQALVTASRTQQRIALLFIDLDRFKDINDSLGHHAGDALLIAVAERLKSCVRESDIVARIGGDEFVIVLNDISDSSRAAIVSENILQKISSPYHLSEQVIDTSPSIGISIYPDDGTNVGDLMRTADVAMYHAKGNGRNNYQYFDEIMLVEANMRLQMERELRTALASDQLVLYYQPQVTAAESKMTALEALVRWQHPRYGLLPPDEFIAVAEDAGLIHELGQWVFEESCRQLVAWKEYGHTECQIAINLSTKQLQSATLVTEFAEIMARHGVSGEDLELEVTESVAMSDPELAVKQLQALRELGLGLAIDDFGTGYSSLAYLKRLPIDVLKLDKSFVRDIESDVNDAEICSATVALAHNLGLKVVAEGVETEEQRLFLQALNCDYLQGFLFSKPLMADEVITLFSRKVLSSTAS